MSSLLLFTLLVPLSSAADSTTLELQSGQNLIGFSVLPADPTITETLSGVSQDVVTIIGEHDFAVQIDGEWIRNFDHFEHNLGYWLQLNLTDPTELEVLGDSTDSDILMQLHKGSNLVNFSCKEDVPVSEAIPDWATGRVNSIMGQGIVATRLDNDWVGSLTELSPNQGYWLMLEGDLPDFSFVCPDGDGQSLHVYGCIDPFASNFDSYANVNDGSCTFNAPASWSFQPLEQRSFVLLNDVRIDNEPIDPIADPVCAHQGNTCLGFGYTRDNWTGITAYEGQVSTPIALKVFDASQNTEVELSLTNPPDFVDGLPYFGGCTDPTASNYHPLATFDIGNCVECDSDSDCDSNDSVCTPVTCQEHACVAQALDCEDDDPCTTDYCLEPDGCVNEPTDDGSCDDTGETGSPSSGDPDGCGCQQVTLGFPWWAGLLPLLLIRRRGDQSLPH